MVDVWIPVISALRESQLTTEIIHKAVQGTKDIVATKDARPMLRKDLLDTLIQALSHLDFSLKPCWRQDYDKGWYLTRIPFKKFGPGNHRPSI